MLNKKIKPLISLPQNEDFAKLIFKKQEELKKDIPIIVIPEEAGDLRNEVQNIANENGIEIAIIGMGDSGKPKIPELMAFNHVPSCTIKKEENEPKRGVSFSFNDLVKDAEPTIPYRGQLLSSKEDFIDAKKPKKERAKNNRKTKKRKKAKNGR